VGTGNWSDPTKWDQNDGTYPDDGLDTAVVDSHTVTVDVDVPLFGGATVNSGGKIYAYRSLSQQNQVTVNNGGVVEFRTSYQHGYTYYWDLTLNDGSLFYANMHEDGTCYSDITVGAGATTTIRHNGSKYHSADLAGVITGPDSSTVNLTRVGSNRDLRIHGVNTSWLSTINVNCPTTLYANDALGVNGGAGVVNVNSQLRIHRGYKSSNVTQPRDLVVNPGGSLYSECHQDHKIYWNGGIQMKTDTTVKVYNKQYTVGPHYFNGAITEDGTPRALTFDIYGSGGYENQSKVYLANPANTFTGGLHVKGGGVLTVTTAGACGDGDVIVYGDTEIEADAVNALDAGNVLYLLTGSNGFLDLDADCEVQALNLGGTWDDVEGTVVGGEWVNAGVYGGAEVEAYQSQFDGYIDFGGNTLTVLSSPAPIAEPAGLGLVGLALLALRRRK
jgi:MYXO-CTERM domain-containing protein